MRKATVEQVVELTIEPGRVPCCNGPHVRPCGPTGDDCFCACGCSGLDERCWIEEAEEGGS